jgi:hypothetical protein
MTSLFYMFQALHIRPTTTSLSFLLNSACSSRRRSSSKAYYNQLYQYTPGDENLYLFVLASRVLTSRLYVFKPLAHSLMAATLNINRPLSQSVMFWSFLPASRRILSVSLVWIQPSDQQTLIGQHLRNPPT